MADELEIRIEGQIRLIEFENRTKLPAIAQLEELEMLGGRYFESKPIKINGQMSKREYVLLDPDGFGRDLFVWKRQGEEKDFTIHLEAETRNKY